MVIVRKMRISLSIAFLSLTILGLPSRAQTRRAVLVGINTYVPKDSTTSQAGSGTPTAETATAVTSKVQKVNPGRGTWSNLRGSLNDIASIRQLLITRFGFRDVDVHVLREQQAMLHGIRN